MDTDYTRYFVDAQGDITYVGPRTAKVQREPIPQAADLRFRNFVFPAVVNLTGDFPAQAQSAVKTDNLPQTTMLPPAGWHATLEALRKDV
jgi:hypothetical protein